MHITILPMGTGTPSVGKHVAGVQKLLREKHADFQLGDMGTIIHGSPGELLQLAAEIHEYPFSRGVQRVVTNIVLDDRRDIDRKIGEKRQAVLNRLGDKQ